MKINVKKTKVMRVCTTGSKREGDNSIKIMIEGQLVEQVNQFLYWDHSSQMTGLVKRRKKVGSQWSRMHSKREASYFQKD